MREGLGSEGGSKGVAMHAHNPNPISVRCFLIPCAVPPRPNTHTGLTPALPTLLYPTPLASPPSLPCPMHSGTAAGALLSAHAGVLRAQPLLVRGHARSPGADR